jgi:AcrR family transcriptional regulator
MAAMTEQLGLRERKKRERRRCIEDAAIDLFDEHGFDATTIDDIAAAADIAPRTFFYYFPTKEDVVLADYAARLEGIIDELDRRPATEAPWAALRAAFVVVAGDYEARRDDLVRRFTIMAANPAVYARSLQLQSGWEDTLTDALIRRSGQTTDNIESRLLSSAALACMRASLRHWLLTAHDTALPDLIEACFDRFADGLATIGDKTAD